MHVLIEVALCAELHVLAGQFVHVFAPCKEYVPSVQSLHVDALDNQEYFPAAHKRHGPVVPATSRYSPGTHPLQLVSILISITWPYDPTGQF